jgi:cell division protein FtsZ
MENITITESKSTTGAKIVVIGVGGAGSNMLQELIGTDIADKITLVAINTDAQALENCNAPHKIQIGKKLTKGLGSGMKPEVGKASAMENYDEIKDLLSGKC